MSSKQQLGQFFTTNYAYILSNMNVPIGIEKIIEPFCGNGDLLNFIDKSKYSIECYDVDPKHDYVHRRDTLMDPPSNKNSFIITNPPYLARNKSSHKEIFDKYDLNDLYKCFIKNLIHDSPIGGIIIIPLNFFCSIRTMDIELRKSFLNTFVISQLNIFEERVFVDTSITVCAFQFELRPNTPKSIPTTIYPSKRRMELLFNDANNYTIGGEIYKLPKASTISRLLENGIPNTNLLLKCIDDNDRSKIRLECVGDDKIYYGKISSRTYATLVISPPIPIDIQKKVAEEFNEYLNGIREKYNSLFLTTYRESKTITRKRISFQLAYQIVNMILEKNHS